MAYTVESDVAIEAGRDLVINLIASYDGTAGTGTPSTTASSANRVVDVSALNEEYGKAVTGVRLTKFKGSASSYANGNGFPRLVDSSNNQYFDIDPQSPYFDSYPGTWNKSNGDLHLVWNTGGESTAEEGSVSLQLCFVKNYD